MSLFFHHWSHTVNGKVDIRGKIFSHSNLAFDLIFIYILMPMNNNIIDGLAQGLLQLQAWVSANGTLKDCTIKVYIGHRTQMKY